jgi:hypothetical protein
MSPSNVPDRLIPDRNLERHYCANIFPRKLAWARRRFGRDIAPHIVVDLDKFACKLKSKHIAPVPRSVAP